MYSHFKIQKNKLAGYITLESMKSRGVFVGLNSNGMATPVVDTGDTNTQLYPEVIDCKELFALKQLFSFVLLVKSLIDAESLDDRSYLSIYKIGL